jgi:PD-(D/E)XK nuclease superfamily
MKIDEFLLKALDSYDKSRARSQQKQVGVSQFGSCRRSVWFQLNNYDKTNETLKLPALMGTGIHYVIEQAFVAQAKETWQKYWLEEAFEYDGIKGHVDMYLPEIGAVIDWKTTKLRNLEYFPSKQQRWQVHLYGWLIKNAGLNDPKTVTLVAIPRDGDERHIKVHTEEYNEEVALEAIRWYREIQSMEQPPEPERYAAQFCQHYCPYFGEKCGGKGKEVGDTTIEDNAVVTAAKRYIEISDEIKQLEAEKDGVKATLENVSGTTPDGIKVAWSQIAGRKSVDEAEVQKLLGYIPYRQGDPTMRLVVK